MAAEYRLAGWAQKIQARQSSGQSIKDFCEAEGISRNAYFYWLRKLRNAACEEYGRQDSEKGTRLIPSGWTKLEPYAPPKEATGLVVEIGEYRVRATTETDPELLAKICRILKTT